MKLILEKWKAYTQSCVDSDDDKGVAVVKKVGSDEVESCHVSKDKAEDAVKARYANYKKESIEEDDVIEEISTMSGGHVQGYAGSAVGDIKTIKKFNKDEKEISKLKGKRLAEMFSTSTQTGGVPQSKVSAEDEHKGHVERSKRQGLKNVMEDDDTTKQVRPKRSPDDPEEKLNVMALKQSGYIAEKKLGEGTYGEVYLVRGDGENKNNLKYAAKIMRGGELSPEEIDTELRNYREISKAREKDELIAKHFANVEEIFTVNYEDEPFDIIIMELLEEPHGELKGILGGVEQLLHIHYPSTAAGTPISKYDTNKDLSKRLETILRDPERLEQIISKIKTYVSQAAEKYDDPEVLQNLDKSIQSSSIRNWERASKDTVEKYIKKAESEYGSLFTKGPLVGSKDQYLAMMDDLRFSPFSRFFIAFVLRKVIASIGKYGNDQRNTPFFISRLLDEIQKMYRKDASLKSGYTAKDFPAISLRGRKKKGRSPDAESIYQAIKRLAKITGLYARDLHGGNIMKRPDGDLVIVDVGMFKTSKEIKDMMAKTKTKKRGRLRENRIKIKIKR